MSKISARDLRVLICEDEYLLAMDMAQQFESLQAEVVGIVSKLSEFDTIGRGEIAANAVVLDWQFVDGKAHDVIAILEQRKIAVVVCSGYGTEERPAEFSHIPWVTKPANADELAAALCAVLEARSTTTSV